MALANCPGPSWRHAYDEVSGTFGVDPDGKIVHLPLRVILLYILWYVLVARMLLQRVLKHVSSRQINQVAFYLNNNLAAWLSMDDKKSAH